MQDCPAEEREAGHELPETLREPASWQHPAWVPSGDSFDDNRMGAEEGLWGFGS